MRPSIRKELRNSWLIFGAAVTLSVIGLAALHSYGPDTERLADERAAYETRRGVLPLSDQVGLQQQANHFLGQRIEELKKQTGLRTVPPFRAPPTEENPGVYLVAAYKQIREALDQIARDRHVAEYDSDMGFLTHIAQGRPPPADELEHWNKMLQLITKACYLALNAPLNSIKEVRADFGGQARVDKTGPAGRPPLLYEYPFELTVRGSLHDVLWLLHELSADRVTEEQGRMLAWLQRVKRKIDQARQQPEDESEFAEAIGPLIVRGIRVQSENLLPEQNLQEIEVTFDLAGMEFLDNQQRGIQGSSAPAPSDTGDGGLVPAGREKSARP